MEEDRGFDLTLRLENAYRFAVDFGDESWPELMLDEPEPLGAGTGPNAARILGAAVGNCLGASLLFCLRRSRVEVYDLRVGVSGTIIRNDKGKLRIRDLRVTLRPGVAEEHLPRIKRCIEVFEDFCIVTQSVRDGLDVQVEVVPEAAGIAAR